MVSGPAVAAYGIGNRINMFVSIFISGEPGVIHLVTDYFKIIGPTTLRLRRYFRNSP